MSKRAIITLVAVTVTAAAIPSCDSKTGDKVGGPRSPRQSQAGVSPTGKGSQASFKIIGAGALSGHRDAVWSVRFSPDGSLLASSSGESESFGLAFRGEIRLWDVKTRKLVRRLKDYDAETGGLAFSTDGKIIVGRAAGAAIAWEVDTGRKLASTPRYSNPDMSADGKFLAGRDEESKSLVVWDTRTGDTVKTLVQPFPSLGHAAFSPDCTLLAACGDKTSVRLWRVGDWAELASLEGHSAAVHALRFSPDGSSLTCGCMDGSAHVWDTETWTKRQILATGSAPRSRVLTYAPDSKALLMRIAPEQPMQLWDLATGSVRTTIRSGRPFIRSLSFSHDSSMLAVASGPDGVVMYDTATGVMIADLNIHTVPGYPLAGASAVAFSPDDRLFATGGFDKTVMLWGLPARAGHIPLRGQGPPEERRVSNPRMRADAATPGEGDASEAE